MLFCYSGVKIIEGVSIRQVMTENFKVAKVETSAGNIKCEYFVNAAGMVRTNILRFSKFLYAICSCISYKYSLGNNLLRP